MGANDTAALGSGQMFDRIAQRYDFVNRVLSVGMDVRWRRATARAVLGDESRRVLDVATGTGDVAITIASMAPKIQLVGLDPSRQMLEKAAEKVARRGLSARVALEVGDAQALPFDDNTFDAVTIAFGIRNVPDRDRALREMARVTRPGGRVGVLELNEPESGWVAPLARWWVHRAVPAIGAFLSGAREYRYLQSSIAAFPTAPRFAEQLGDNGLSPLECRRLGFGACTLFVTEKESGS